METANSTTAIEAANTTYRRQNRWIALLGIVVFSGLVTGLYFAVIKVRMAAARSTDL